MISNLTVRVCLPWRPDGGHRDRLWAYCRERWLDLDLGWPICIGNNDDETFSRARSLNRAASGSWDVVVIADADIVPAGAEQVREAVELAARRQSQVYGFDVKHALTEGATDAALAAGVPLASADGLSTPNTLSSLFAIGRSLWDRLGGFDERFVGWGFEDLCFNYAAETLGGPAQRIPGDVYDLWHPRPRASQEESPTYPANEALWHRYLIVRGDTAGMGALLAEPR